MKIIVNTCNTHLHLVPIFCHLFNKYWGENQPVTMIGYNHPNSFSESFNLPDNFEFVQLNGGDQQTVNDFSNHMHNYFSTIEDDYFIWVNEDTFLKAPVNFDIVNTFYEICKDKTNNKIGRIDMTEGMSDRGHSLWQTINGIDVLVSGQNTDYRVAIQMSIWNKEYLLKYLVPNYSPWDVEIAAIHTARNDGWDILGTHKDVALAVEKNEGVTRHDIYAINTLGMDKETRKEIQEIINGYE
jgi:hypothetical protein